MADPGLDQISTHWPQLGDPVQFMMRYAPAIQAYFGRLIRNTHDADEVTQDFLLRGLTHGFLRTTQLHGRFRDYLKTAVRNAALTYLTRKRAPASLEPGLLPQEEENQADAEWLSQWYRCVIDRAFQALEHQERQHADQLYWTVLRLKADYPEEDSRRLAARATERTGRPLSAEAFRKQLSRARRCFAELLAGEIARTLAAPTRQSVESELIELGLMPLVRDFLPADWSPPTSNRRS
jgi:Sigma-70 region 2